MFIFTIFFFFSFCLGSSVVELNDKNIFQSVEKGKWFVEFYAPWCGHCKALQPIWENLADSLKNEIHVGKVDVTENKGCGEAFHIRGYPTIFLIEDYKAYKYEGLRTVEAMTQWARGEYQKGSYSKLANAPVEFMDQVKKFYSSAISDLKVLFSDRIDIGILFTAIGFFLGMVVALIFVRPKRIEKEARPVVRNTQPVDTPSTPSTPSSPTSQEKPKTKVKAKAD